MLSKFKRYFIAFFAIFTLGFATSCGNNAASNIQIAGVQGPTLSLVQDNLVVSMVFENIQLEGGLRYNIPKYKYSFVEISPDAQSSGTLMNITISLKDVINGNLDTLDPQKLPGGRNLPGVTTGALPAVAFSIQKFHNMAFYLGKNLFGIFVPVNVGVDGAIASFRYYMNSKAAGTISLVGNDPQGENSGILLMINLSGATQTQMMKVYKKFNP